MDRRDGRVGSAPRRRGDRLLLPQRGAGPPDRGGPRPPSVRRRPHRGDHRAGARGAGHGDEALLRAPRPHGLHHDREEGPRAAPPTPPIGIATSRTGWTTFGPKRGNRSGGSGWTGVTTPGAIHRA